MNLKPDLVPLFVPLLDPGGGTQSSEVLLKELARLVLPTLNFLATVEVDIILPAVPRLVLVREPRVKRDCLHLSVVGHFLL